VNALPGVQSVLARMAAIEARFGTARPPVATAVPGAAFDERLASALGTAPTRTAALDVPAGFTPAATGTRFDALFDAAGAAHGVDPALLAAVARVESGLDPTAVSPAGARGLMQLMPSTAAGLGVDDPFDPAQAVDGAARLLRSHLDRFGSLELALAAYNAGAGAVARYGGIPPYPETQAYVRRVLERYGATT
jgi:soluble lytic murein transglycosylase-like protein